MKSSPSSTTAPSFPSSDLRTLMRSVSFLRQTAASSITVVPSMKHAIAASAQIASGNPEIFTWSSLPGRFSVVRRFPPRTTRHFFSASTVMSPPTDLRMSTMASSPWVPPMSMLSIVISLSVMSAAMRGNATASQSLGIVVSNALMSTGPSTSIDLKSSLMRTDAPTDSSHFCVMVRYGVSFGSLSSILSVPSIRRADIMRPEIYWLETAPSVTTFAFGLIGPSTIIGHVVAPGWEIYA